MKKIYFFTLFVFFFCPLDRAVANNFQQPIMITVNVINTSIASTNKWGFLNLRRYSGYKSEFIYNVFNNADRNKEEYFNGKLLFVLPISQSSIVDLDFFTGSKKATLCRLKIDALSTSKATITQLESTNNTSIQCEYSGDPMKNTATIRITDK